MYYQIFNLGECNCSFLIGSLDLAYQPLYLRFTLYESERHKQVFFMGSQSFVDKKKSKSRLGEQCTKEIQEILDIAVPVTTRKLQSTRLDYLAVRTR